MKRVVILNYNEDMENLYFKAIFQKTTENKAIMVAVVPDDFICNGLPVIFEVQAVKVAPTIYTGTYPTIRLIPETIKDRTEDLKGLGISGILTQPEWFIKTVETEDQLGIGLPKS